jgi:uncharacterized protein (UPF0218 family)
MLDDPRPVEIFARGEGDTEEWWKVGSRDVSKIVIYGEPGQGAMVPWAAIYCGDEIVARADCAGATIFYKV